MIGLVVRFKGQAVAYIFQHEIPAFVKAVTGKGWLSKLQDMERAKAIAAEHHADILYPHIPEEGERTDLTWNQEELTDALLKEIHDYWRKVPINNRVLRYSPEYFATPGEVRGGIVI